MELKEYIGLRHKQDGRNLWGLTAGTSHADRIFLEHIWRRHPAWKNIVELGTFTGATALYLGMLARTRGGTLYTFDNIDVRPDEVRRAWLDNMHFLRTDVLQPGQSAVVRIIKEREIGLVFFDNGDKTMEVELYANLLNPGAGALIHDWEIEVNKPLALGSLVFCDPLYDDVRETLGATARYFERRR